MRLDPAGHVQRVRAHDPDPQRRHRPPRRSAVHTRCSMCQSCGAVAMSAASASASACVAVATAVAAAVRGHRDRVAHGCGPPVRGERRERRDEQRAGARGEPGRPRRELRGLAEERHLEPGGAQIAVRDQADQAARAQPLGQRPVDDRTVAGRQHLEAEPLPVRHEPAEQRLRTQPFDHGGESGRPAEAPLGLDEPQPGEVPVAAVRQRRDDATALLERLEHRRHARHVRVRPGQHRGAVHGGQPEGLAPVAGVAAQPRPHQRLQLLGRGGGHDAPQVGPQPADPGAVPAGGEVRAEPERLAGDGFGQATDDAPARRRTRRR